ncbi:MAG: hypothetical protein KBC30_01320 [Planctomycetes bacterium]|jgi:hypothetical protein|nr:hypothetical protein [Planctomycetota bacterium]
MACNIRVTCSCGKILKVPPQYAGKKGRCPSCGKAFPIPSIEEIKEKQETQVEKQVPEEPEERHCPTCGAFMAPGETTCVSCHMDLNTGEWNMAGAKATIPSTVRMYKMGALGIVALLIFMVTLFFIHNLTKQSIEIPPTSVPTQETVAVETEIVTGTPMSNVWASIFEKPAETLQELDEKINIVDQAISKGTSYPEIMMQYQNLMAQKQELQAKEDYEAEKTDDIFKQWLLIEKISYKYADTKFVQETLAEERTNNVANMIKLCQDYKNEHLQGKNPQTIGATNFDWLVHNLQSLYPAEFIYELTNLAHGDIESYTAETTESGLPETSISDIPSTQTVSSSESSNTELDELKDWLEEFLPIYREYQKTRKFANAYNDIARHYKATYSQQYANNPEISRIEQLQEESDLLNNIFITLLKSLETHKDKEMTLFLIAQNPKTGILKNIQTVQTEDALGKYETIVFTLGTEKIYFDQIATHTIGKLILDHEDNSKDLKSYLSLACFYYVENDASACRDICNQALKLGVPFNKIEPYQQWAAGVFQEKKDLLATQTARQKEQKRRDEQVKETARIGRLRKRAREMIYKMLEEYKNHKEIAVLDYLVRLKEEIGDQPNGRDELVKLNYILKQEEGHSLSAIADNAYNYCLMCSAVGNASGVIKCPDCQGTGIIKEKDRYSTNAAGAIIKIEGQKRLCKRCNAKGEIPCPKCTEKRHNRKYQVIKSYYNNF